MASKAEYDKVLKYVEAGKQSTTKLVAGSGVRKVNGKGLFIESTIFANTTNDLKINREEIFGPVLPVIPSEGEEEAIRIATGFLLDRGEHLNRYESLVCLRKSP